MTLAKAEVAIWFVVVSAFVSSAAPQEKRPQQFASTGVADSILAMSPADKLKALALVKTCDTPAARSLWQRLIIEAMKTQSTQESKCIFLYEVAAAVARQLQEDKLIGESLDWLARAYFNARDYQNAEAAFREAETLAEKLNLKPNVISDLSVLGWLYVRSAKYREASDVSLRSISTAATLQDPSSEASLYAQAVAYDNLANVAIWEGQGAKALEYFEKSSGFFTQLARTFKGRYESGTFKSLLGFGFVYYNSGDYGTALQFYNQALAIADASRNPEWLIAVLNALGNLYLDEGDYTKATDFLNRAYDAAKRTTTNEYVLSALHNLAVADQRQGNYEAAARKFGEVLSLAEKLGRQDSIVSQLEGLGSAYHKMGQYDRAMAFYNRALEIADRLEDKTHQCELNWLKAGIHYERGAYDKSREFAAIASKLADELSEPNLAFLALTQSGKAYLALGQFELARTDLLRAIEKAEQIRGSVGGQEQERALFFERKIEPYYLMVDLFIRQQRPQEAVLFAERARSRVLLDLLARGRPDVSAVLSSTERDEEKKLNGQLAALNTQLYRESGQLRSDQELLKELRARIEKARVDYDSFQDRVYGIHPELRISRGRTTALQVEDLPSTVLGSDSAVLEFELLDDKAYVFALSLGDDGKLLVDSYQLNVSAKTLGQKVEAFRERVANRGLGVDKLSAELYSLLVAPAASDLKGRGTLVVVPDGVLWDLPFQALKNNNRYLIEDHSIFYAPSLTALREMTRRKRSTSPPALAYASTENDRSPMLLAFGNPALTFRQTDQADSGKQNQGDVGDRPSTMRSPAVAKRDDQLGPLPEAETEVKTLAKLYGPDRSRVFVGADATEERAKAEMGQSRILHFAAHGILDSANPLYSHIVLSQSSVSQRATSNPEVVTDDGLLEAREIMNMNLKADLAVLSACQMARGRISTGEGVIGMSWAFFAAGCPTTVVSQWSVESQSTTELMIEFHRNLLSGQKMGKAEALRQASLKLLKTEKYRHPFYWAGFIVMGDGR